MKRNTPQPAGLVLPVGPFDWQLYLVRGLIELPGDKGEGVGFCDFALQRILIASHFPPRRRVQVLFHELAHAWSFELDIAEGGTFKGESLANMIEVGMARIDAGTLRRIERYLMDDDNAIELDNIDAEPRLALAAKVSEPPRRRRERATA